MNTYFGMVPIPVGNLSTLVFPLDRTKENYLLLSAQTKSIQGRIEFEEIREVTTYIRDIYRRSFCCRGFAYFFIKSFSYMLVLLTFLFLILLFLSLVQSAGVQNLYILGAYFVLLICLFLTHWTSKYQFTRSLRSAHREAEAYLLKVNFELRHAGLSFRLGKNLLWVELHLLDLGGEDGGSSTKIPVNLGAPLAAVQGPSFKPTIKRFSMPATEAQFDEQAAKHLQQLQREAPPGPNPKPKEDVAVDPPNLQDVDDEDVKMIGNAQV